MINTGQPVSAKISIVVCQKLCWSWQGIYCYAVCTQLMMVDVDFHLRHCCEMKNEESLPTAHLWGIWMAMHQLLFASAGAVVRQIPPQNDWYNAGHCGDLNEVTLSRLLFGWDMPTVVLKSPSLHLFSWTKVVALCPLSWPHCEMLACLNNCAPWSSIKRFPRCKPGWPLGKCEVWMPFLSYLLGENHWERWRGFVPSRIIPGLVSLDCCEGTGCSWTIWPVSKCFVSIHEGDGLIWNAAVTREQCLCFPLIGWPSLCLLLLWCPAEQLLCSAHVAGSVSMATPLGDSTRHECYTLFLHTAYPSLWWEAVCRAVFAMKVYGAFLLSK